MRALLVLILLVPACSADQTFHLTAQGMTLGPVPEGPGEATPLSQRGLVAPGEHSVVEWSYVLKSGASIQPRSTTIHFEVTKETVVPASVYVLGMVNACSWYLQLWISEDKWWYYCSNQYQGELLTPGVYGLEFDWGDLDAQPASAGTRIYVRLTTGATSDDGAPSLHVLGGGSEADSVFVLAGTHEPEPAPTVAATTTSAAPAPETTSAAPATATPTATPSAPPPSPSPTAQRQEPPTATAAPATTQALAPPVADAKGSPGLPVALALVALAAVAIRRRLA